MPGLFSDVKKDLSMFKKLFTDSRFRPDMLKIYPVLVMENTKLYDLWKNKKFSPYTNEDFEKFTYEFYKEVPHWVRIMRIQRDIPSTKISAGPTKSNMREIVLDKLKKEKYTH
jgi:elongator complex protein 3